MTMGNQTCAQPGTACTCNTQWEKQCWSGEGNSSYDFYCVAKTDTCPCTGSEMDCFSYAYDLQGQIVGDTPPTCVTAASQCICGANALSPGCLEGADFGMSGYVMC